MQTAPKSTMPVEATCRAATQETSGSYSRASAGGMRRTGRPLALARSYRADRRGISDSSVATMSLPQTSYATPCSLQNSTIDAAPARHMVALRLPGL